MGPASPSGALGAFRATVSSGPLPLADGGGVSSVPAAATATGFEAFAGGVSSAPPPLAAPALSSASSASATGAAVGFLAPDGARPRSTAEPSRREKPSRTSAAILFGLAPPNEPSPLTDPSRPLRTVSLAFFFDTSPVTKEEIESSFATALNPSFESSCAPVLFAAPSISFAPTTS